MFIARNCRGDRETFRLGEIETIEEWPGDVGGARVDDMTAYGEESGDDDTCTLNNTHQGFLKRVVYPWFNMSKVSTCSLV